MNDLYDFATQISKGKNLFVFLGGIHGVGKTTLCNNIFKELGYQCVTASSLIKDYGFRIRTDKQVKSISDNQKALIEQLSIEKHNHNKLLLDGHFSLVNSQQEIECIELDVFQSMSPDQLILITANPEIIAQRLENRDSHKWDALFIKIFQEVEEKHARYISKELNIPLQVFHTNRYLKTDQ